MEIEKFSIRKETGSVSIKTVETTTLLRENIVIDVILRSLIILKSLLFLM